MKKTYKFGLLVLILAAGLAFAFFRVFYTPDLDDEDVAYVLAGGLQPRSVIISFKTFEAAKVRVQLSTDAVAYSDPIFSDYFRTEASNFFLGKVKVDSLMPGRQYYYQLEVNDTLGVFDGYSGTFRTPQEGPFSFKIAFGACAENGSDSEVFTRIQEEEPLLYLNVGDLHYGNIDDDCREDFAEAYYRVFATPIRTKLYRSTAFAYMWDDHDYGENNSGITAVCRPIALDAYRTFIPHYPLEFKENIAPISQSFSIGRLRFLLTDLRSHKIEPEYLGCERTKQGTNFGTKAHLAWFKEELLKARNAGQMVVWISSIPFINGENGPNFVCDEDDDWGGFPEERAEIATFVEMNNIPACILAGDAHMVAIDDGTNSDYGKTIARGMPVFQAAPLDRYGSYKGGPYSHGYSAESGQYGVMEVEDNGGDEICIRWVAKNEDGEIVTNNQGEPIEYEFCKKVTDLESLQQVSLKANSGL